MNHQHDPAIVSAMQQEIQQLAQHTDHLPTLHQTLAHLTGAPLHEVATLPLKDLRRQIHEAAATHGSTVTLWPAVEVLQAHVSPTAGTDVGDRLTQLFGVEPSGPRTLH